MAPCCGLSELASETAELKRWLALGSTKFHPLARRCRFNPTLQDEGLVPVGGMIFAAWHDTPVLYKITRLARYIRWSEKHDVLVYIFAFINNFLYICNLIKKNNMEYITNIGMIVCFLTSLFFTISDLTGPFIFKIITRIIAIIGLICSVIYFFIKVGIIKGI